MRIGFTIVKKFNFEDMDTSCFNFIVVFFYFTFKNTLTKIKMEEKFKELLIFHSILALTVRL